jgi:PleD family two-component response regulator
MNFPNDHQNTENNQDQRHKIIIVDDVKVQVMMTKERLRKYYDVYTAQSFDELLELLANVKPELIILDVNLPDVDGYEITEILKDDERYRNIPIIFLSGKSDKKSIMAGAKAGAVDFIKKPCTDTEMHEAIELQLNPDKRKTVRPVVLAVDDSPSVLKSINYILQAENKVYTLPNSNQLLALLKMVTPDMFILDCNMPEISGFDLVPIIRKHPEHEETPIVFLTALGTADNVSVAATLGACEFIIKPIDENILREKTALHLKDFLMTRRIRQYSGRIST